jgi:hypothetical protein
MIFDLASMRTFIWVPTTLCNSKIWKVDFGPPTYFTYWPPVGSGVGPAKLKITFLLQKSIKTWFSISRRCARSYESQQPYVTPKPEKSILVHSHISHIGLPWAQAWAQPTENHIFAPKVDKNMIFDPVSMRTFIWVPTTLCNSQNWKVDSGPPTHIANIAKNAKNALFWPQKRHFGRCTCISTIPNARHIVNKSPRAPHYPREGLGAPWGVENHPKMAKMAFSENRHWIPVCPTLTGGTGTTKKWELEILDVDEKNSQVSAKSPREKKK